MFYMHCISFLELLEVSKDVETSLKTSVMLLAEEDKKELKHQVCFCVNLLHKTHTVFLAQFTQFKWIEIML